jgi:hypothetical protein
VFCLDSLASITQRYVLYDISLHAMPPISGLQVLAHLGTTWMDRICSRIGLRLGTHIHFPNHKVPWSSSVKSLVLFSFMNYHISFSFSSSSCAFLISASSVGSISTAIAASFTIARLIYPNSWHNIGHLSMASVALQCFLRLKASATMLAFPGW